MKKIIPYFLMSVFFLISLGGFSQENTQKVEMADVFYESGKIYVVIGVLCLIFSGIVVFLVTMERRLRKLEKEQ